MSDRIRQFGQITCLYDMDIVDPHQFSEVYLYEELMEADLHAIVRPHTALALTWLSVLLLTNRSALVSRYRTPTSSPSSTKRSAVSSIFTQPAFCIGT